MRALHLTLSYQSAPALGGPDLTAYKLCTALKDQSICVDVICTNLATKNSVIQSKRFERDIDGVHVTYLPTKKLIPLGKNSFGAYFIPKLKPLLKRILGCYDVIHLQGFRDYVSIIGSLQAQAAGVPYVLHPRGTIPHQGHSVLAKSVFDRTLGQRMIRKAGALIALSNREIGSFLELGADSNKIEIVNNGIDGQDYGTCTSGTAFREKHGISERFVVLYFGRVHAIKGIDHMVRAVAGLSRNGLDVAAMVVGPDEGYAASLKKIAKKERFEHLYLIPTVSGKAKREVFGAADVLVYASHVEDFGVSAFEGILSGVPTVVAAETGCGEIVGRLDAGMLIPYGDVDALKCIIRDIYTAPQYAREYTLAARKRVTTELGWTERAKQVKHLYERMVFS